MPKRSDLFAGRWVFVTGASSGLGEAFARQLAARRAHLVVSARRGDVLDRLAAELRGAHGVEVRVVPADLGVPGGAQRLADEVQAIGLPIAHLVNNAGFGAARRFADNEVDRLAEMVRLNCEAVTVLSRRFLPAMLERQSGGILHVASVAAFQPVPFMATYGATKAFVLSLSVALSEEVRGSGVRVMALCPGPVPTGFQAAAGISRPSAMQRAALSADDAVKRALTAYEEGRDVCVPGAMNLLSAIGARLVPRSLATRAAGTMMRRAGRS